MGRGGRTRETHPDAAATNRRCGGVCPGTQRIAMKPISHRHPSHPLAILLLAALAAPAVAQELVETEQQPDESGPFVVSMEFQGGSVSEFAATVRKQVEVQQKRWINLLVAGPATDVKIPAMQVRDAELTTLFQAASALIQPRFFLELETMHDGNGSPLIVVRTIRNEEQEEPAPARQLRVLPLRALTSTIPGEPSELALTAETILNAAQTALDLQKDDGPVPTLRFHESSGLMFVNGSPAQLDVVTDVVNQLSSDIEILRMRLQKAQRGPGHTPGPSGPSGPGTSGR